MIKREKARKLPGSISSALQERLIREAISGWEGRAFHYFDDVTGAMRSLLSDLCNKHFGRFEKSGLYTEVW